MNPQDITSTSETDSVEKLKKTLCDSKAPLRLRFRALFSLKSLGREGNKEAIDSIAAGFGDSSDLLKHELAYVLGQTGQREFASPHLEKILKDSENQSEIVRHEAAEALGALEVLPSSSSYELLKSLYENKLESEVIRQTCELSLARIAWKYSNLSKEEKIIKSSFDSIDPAPPLPVDYVLEGVNNNNNNNNNKEKFLGDLLNDQSKPLFDRYRAMFRLRDIGTTEAIEALASALNDPSALLRHEIAYVFGQMSDSRSVPALVKCVNNKSEIGMVRHEAAEALGSIATDPVLDVLRGISTDSERVVRESAEVALDMYEYERSGEVEYVL